MCQLDILEVEQLMAVTGVSKEIATNLLEACGGNIEMAVNMFSVFSVCYFQCSNCVSSR